jgi:hypothetical protein
VDCWRNSLDDQLSVCEVDMSTVGVSSLMVGEASSNCLGQNVR